VDSGISSYFISRKRETSRGGRREEELSKLARTFLLVFREGSRRVRDGGRVGCLVVQEDADNDADNADCRCCRCENSKVG